MKILRVIVSIATGVTVTLLVGVAVIAGGAGVFWLYLFGDDPWPSYAEPLLLIAAALLAFVAGTAAGFGAWVMTRGPRIDQPNG